MLSVEEYRARVLALASLTPVEECAIGSGFGRVVAEDMVARCAVPPFDNSAMDGFAVRSADTLGGAHLTVVADLPAGTRLAPLIGAGQAARIMTGAPLPPGADAVVPVEDTDQSPGDVPLPDAVRVPPVAVGAHVRRAAEDVAVGAVVVPRGQRWTPASAAAAAAVGHARVRLHRRPTVAVLATGSELLPAGAPLGYGQIPDSNSVLLAGLVEQFGGQVVCARAVSDDLADFRQALVDAADAEVIVTSGGVSVGAFEVVRQAVEGSIEFVRVAMQPGKPQASGRIRDAAGREHTLVALPGNPVGAFVSAWVFVRPFLDACQGAFSEPPTLRIAVADGWRTPPGRAQFMPVVITPDGVRPAHRLGSGSHLIASLHAAEALAFVPADVERVAPGDVLDVHLVR